MQLKKIILTLSFIASIHASADDQTTTDSINYDWTEIVYGTDTYYNSNISTFKPAKSLMVNESISLTDRFYISGNLGLFHENSEYRLNKDEFSQVQLSASLGFHTRLFKRTDFISEVGIEYLRTSNIGMEKFSFDLLTDDIFIDEIFIDNSSYNVITKVGTRTQFNDKFQLDIALTYVDHEFPNTYDQINSDGSSDIFYRFSPDERDLNVNLDLFYKINKRSQLKFGISTKEGETISLGYRWNW